MVGICVVHSAARCNVPPLTTFHVRLEERGGGLGAAFFVIIVSIIQYPFTKICNMFLSFTEISDHYTIII